ncbi:MAG: prolipoprotein diacylglyceryl transferase [Ignavibacteriae bacterium]|nr:prolipoprotein diacylglyceryl transferase [Ignavibacteriota bacterium]
MIPILFKIGPLNIFGFQIGPIPIYSFGLMLGIGFLLGSYILSLELKRKKIDPNLASNITIIALLFGIAGAKLFHLIENWEMFLRAPLEATFSAGGLTWYGGLIIGMTAIILYLRAKKVPVLKVIDGLGVALILAYGVARLGCHLAGDGDYGMPTNLPWGTNYENGTYPPSRAFAIFPEVTSQYPNGIVPDNTPCHPTPVYEMILGVLGFLLMWKYFRKQNYPDGMLFAIYLVMSSLFRFSIEFLRLNPRLLWGLSEAQLIGIVLFALGVGWILLLRKKMATAS